MVLSAQIFYPVALSILSTLKLSAAHPTPLRPVSGSKCSDPYIPAPIEWAACPSDVGFPETVLCGQLSVPIDWNYPKREKFNLGVVKLASSSNSTSKIGSLFINPGGPGGSASATVAQLAVAPGLLGSLGEAFDIIGLDPRGVGLSNAVKCDADIYNERVSIFPTTQQEFDSLVDKNARFGKSCRDLTGPLVEHMDTLSVVKDHEAARIALGDQKLNFLGLSYGSQIAAQYAQLYPDKIRTLVLDGVLQHSQSEESNIRIEGVAYESALKGFFDWAATDSVSVLAGQNVTALWIKLIEDATATPIPALGCDGTTCRTDVTAEDILRNTPFFLTYAIPDFFLPQNWGTLSQALAQASKGNATILSSSLASAEGSAAYAGDIVGCLDWTHESSNTLAGVTAKWDMVKSVAPLTRGATQSWAIQHKCLGWPVAAVNPPAKLDVKTDVTVLMVNSLGDHSTSYAWAESMLDEIENSVLLTREGYGHTSFILGGEAAQLIGTYLVSGVAPAKGTVVKT